MLPYFKKSVTFHPPTAENRPANVTLKYDTKQFYTNIDPKSNTNTGEKGDPLQVSFPRWIKPISTWLGQAFDALGLAHLPAFSDSRLAGWFYFTYGAEPTSKNAFVIRNSIHAGSPTHHHESQFLYLTRKEGLIRRSCRNGRPC